jgi:hypothetical protein
MHDCRSKRWSGTNRTAPLHPASNQLLSCWKLACLPACLQSSTGLVRWCAYCWDLYHYNVIIIHSSSYCDSKIQVKAPRFTAHSGRCQAASCLDRMSSASETDVQVYMWYYGTKLSDDISPLRSMYVLGSGHLPDHHRSRGSVHLSTGAATDLYMYISITSLTIRWEHFTNTAWR